MSPVGCHHAGDPASVVSLFDNNTSVLEASGEYPRIATIPQSPLLTRR
jgi:hypothetical protein